jgi:polysaccharide biosynthesis/export protein
MCPDGASAPVAERPPAELDKMSLPTYRIEPPDVLLVGLINTVPKDPYFLRTLDILQIYVSGTPEEQPIAGEYQVQPDGTLNLGPSYGTVAVKGLTLVETRDAISRQLSSVGYDGSDISVYLREPSGLQQLAGEKIVGPDGMVNLGIYGNVYVTGMTLSEARAAMEEKLSEYFERPKLSLDIFAYNSKTYYIVTEGAGFGDQVLRLPASGNETVLDAVAGIGGLTQLSSKRIWISRPAPVGSGCDQILTVDWDAITRGASTSTNYQVLPGDRIFIAEDRLFAASNFVSRVLDPIERVFGFTLLGAQSVQSTQRFPGGF